MALTDRVRIVNVPDGCGGSLTNASFSGLTPSILQGYSLVEHNKAKVIAMAKEARTIGVVGKSLVDLMYSRIKEVGKDAFKPSPMAGLGEQSAVLPYKYRKRKSRIGNPQFLIASGSANAFAGTTNDGIVYPVSARNIVVNIGPGYVSNLGSLDKFFLPGQFLYVEGINVSTSAKTTTPFRIITASTTGGVTTVVVAANRSDTWWGSASSEEKAPYQPTHGVVFIGGNDIHAEESWCYSERSDKSLSFVVDWIQYTRYTQCVTDIYESTLAKILKGDVNDVAKIDGYLSIAEQNAQQAKIHENKWMTDVWFGDIIDENQTPNTYTDLPPVYDPSDDTTVIGYKSRALGIRTILANYGNVIDMTGGALDLDLLLSESGKLYEIYRVRSADGSDVKVIDLMTDRTTASVLRGAIRAIQTAFYGVDSIKYYTPGQVLDGARVAFQYERYQIPGLPFDVAVFTDSFFDDRIAAAGDGTGGLNGSVNLKNSARSIWALDWSDITLSVGDAQSVTRTLNGDAAANVLAEFNCRIKLNAKKTSLRQIAWTLEIGDEARHCVIENFSTAQPTYTLGAGAGYVYS